jgi:ABC-type transport system substrate-binding protein
MLMSRALWLGRVGSGLLIAAVVLTTAALASPGASERLAREGGTFRVAAQPGRVVTIDPALVGSIQEIQLLDAACATLIAYPEKPPPEGFRLAPSIAEAEPVVSRNGKAYTFTIRKDARFSDGKPVTAHAFAHALERILDPGMRAGFSQAFVDIVGAREMLAGTATTLAGAVAKGRVLTLRLTKRVRDLLIRLAQVCAVPPNLPAAPEGAKAPLASPAPYYVAEYVPGERIVLERNRFYRGERPHHVERFVADLAISPGEILDQVARGAFDTLVGQFGGDETRELARRYGVNKSRFWVLPGAGLRIYHLNVSRPLFRNNARLRQAVNFAVDRKALAREPGFLVERPTDQYLPPGMPGYRDERIYPLEGPDVRRARLLAKGRTRDGKAVLYTTDNIVDTAQAQILRRNLRQIGIELEIKQFPVPLYFDKLVTPGEPFDLARVRYGAADATFLNCLFERSGGCNRSHFDSARYNRLLGRASRLSGEARDRAYGDLDVQLSRDAAPAIPVSVVNGLAFVSAKVGCIVLNPYLDLTAVCLK